MSYATARKLVNDLLPAMPALADQGGPDDLTHLIARSGLLRQPTADSVDFVHRTFQDYLGALSSHRNSRPAPPGQPCPRHPVGRRDADGRRPCARPAERAELLTKLIERGDQESEHRARLHLLAAASLPYATETKPEIRRMVTERAAARMFPRTRKAGRHPVGPGVPALLIVAAHRRRTV